MMENEERFPISIDMPELTPEKVNEIMEQYRKTGLQFYKSANGINITGDSGEYEFLVHAVELSKHIPGLCLELGLRLGMGTKTIIDAVAQFCPEKIVVAIDPYGSILYKPRDHMPECRLDYTLGMRNECLGNMYPYSQEKGVQFKFIELSDTDFFKANKDGVIVYDLERKVINQYSMVHLDGPHSVEAINEEVDFFSERMVPGAILVIDDITEDFLPLERVELHMGINDESGRFERVKKGIKKAIYKRI